MGFTETEDFLHRLAYRSFFSLWSFPNPYSDEGKKNTESSTGKEIADLLVVFDNHVLLFSDKHRQCNYSSCHKQMEISWQRWKTKVVDKSVKQLHGAASWIKRFPNRIYADSKCNNPIPLAIPSQDCLVVHKILVANGASEACRSFFCGDSGSLLITSSEEVVKNLPFRMFLVSCVEKNSREVYHIFDESNLDLILRELDTISDFIDYLTKKERFLLSNQMFVAHGEEELLAHYITNLNGKGEHDFLLPRNFSMDSGFWETYHKSDQRKSKQDANLISYQWDELIKRFAEYVHANKNPFDISESILRCLASENRTSRRALVIALLDLISKTPPEGGMRFRVTTPEGSIGNTYVFFICSKPMGMPYGVYRETRRNLLFHYCRYVSSESNIASNIIGYTTDIGRRTEDIVYVRKSEVSRSDVNVSIEELQRFNLANDANRIHYRTITKEYPSEVAIDNKIISRNQRKRRRRKIKR